MRRIVGSVFAIVCALGAFTFVLAQDGTPTSTPGTGACASPAAVSTASPAATATTEAAGTPTPCATGSSLSLEMVDISFNPKQLNGPANTPITLTLHNSGVAQHNFSIDALHISQDVAPGATVTVTINGPAGQYQYYCNVPGHKAAGMVGTLTLQ